MISNLSNDTDSFAQNVSVSNKLKNDIKKI